MASTTSRHPGWQPLVACCLSTFLLLLYTSVVTVALPSIGTGLDAGFGAQQWVVDGYTVALAGLLLGAGALGDATGSRRVHLAGLTGFTAATLACGLAGSPGWLIGARAAQGVAGAALLATILPLIAETYPEPRQRATAFGVWGAVAGGASAVGTVGGGLLTAYAGWRWLFWAGLPLCLLALVLARRSLPRTPRSASAPVDLRGIVLITVAVTACAGAVIGGGSAWAGAVAVLAVAGFVRAERRCPHPVLPLGLIASPRFAAVLLTAFGYYFAAFGALPALATWLQTDLGVGPLATSLVLVGQLLVFIAVSGLLSRHLHALAPAWTIGAGTVLVGLGALAGTALALGPAWLALAPFLALTGFGAGLVSPALPALAIAGAPAHQAGVASSAANAVRQLGLALGVAACGTLAGDATGTVTRAGLSAALAACALTALGTGTVAAALLRRCGPSGLTTPSARRGAPDRSSSAGRGGPGDRRARPATRG